MPPLTAKQRAAAKRAADRHFRRYRSQPRIPGVTRESFYSALHPDVKAGIRRIARSERRSPSWVLAEIVSMFFDIDAATGKPLAKVPIRHPDKQTV